MEVNLLSADHTQDVYDLLRPFFDEGHWNENGEYSPENTVKYIMEFLYHAETLGGYIDGKLHGIIVAEICYEFDVRPYGYITNFYTSPESRGSGLSRLLVEECLKLCDNANCRNVYAANTGILTNKANNLFDNMLKKHGFVPMSNLLIRGRI